MFRLCTQNIIRNTQSKLLSTSNIDFFQEDVYAYMVSTNKKLDNVIKRIENIERYTTMTCNSNKNLEHMIDELKLDIKSEFTEVKSDISEMRHALQSDIEDIQYRL